MVTAQTTGAVAAQTKSSGMLSLQDQGRKFIETGVADPFVTGFLIFAASLGLNAITNTIHYIKKRKAGKKALEDTFKESGIMGVCATIGIVAGNAMAATGVVLIAPAVLPVIAGLAATGLIKNFLNKTASAPRKMVLSSPSIERRVVRIHRPPLRKTTAVLS